MQCFRRGYYNDAVTWKYINNGWVSAITICGQHLYTPARIIPTTPPPTIYNAFADGSSDAFADASFDASVSTDLLSMGNDADATVGGTVINQGSTNLTAYGFVWNTTGNPTLSDNVVTVGTGSFTGSFSNHITNLIPYFGTAYFAAYATDSQDTSYGTILSDSIRICLAAGTFITMGNKLKKKIEDITYDDNLLVWNFDDGKYAQAKPIWMVKPFKSYCGVVKFSNGSELKTIADGKGHRIFNLGKNMFTHMMNDDTPLGTKTITDKNEVISVIEKKVAKEAIFYNIITTVQHTRTSLTNFK